MGCTGTPALHSLALSNTTGNFYVLWCAEGTAQILCMGDWIMFPCKKPIDSKEGVSIQDTGLSITPTPTGSTGKRSLLIIRSGGGKKSLQE